MSQADKMKVSDDKPANTVDSSPDQWQQWESSSTLWTKVLPMIHFVMYHLISVSYLCGMFSAPTLDCALQNPDITCWMLICSSRFTFPWLRSRSLSWLTGPRQSKNTLVIRYISHDLCCKDQKGWIFKFYDTAKSGWANEIRNVSLLYLIWNCLAMLQIEAIKRLLVIGLTRPVVERAINIGKMGGRNFANRLRRIHSCPPISEPWPLVNRCLLAGF